MSEEITIKKLQDMKSQMAQRGNWKEVERIKKVLSFRPDGCVNNTQTPNQWMCK